ncbi:MAG: RluA family pseudouridine synthase [Treponema sp.]|nr:RluA family pseudouridine synthase [Treponema sp.]
MKNIDILYEDDISIIVNKPAGLAVQGGKGIKTSLDKILAQNHKGTIETTPLLVHRLDRDTSGVLLAAKGQKAAAHFSNIISKKIVKVYIAVCKGCPPKNEGLIKDELYIHGKLKKSETRYKTIKTSALELPFGEVEKKSQEKLLFSVLEIELITGRMHQIRRHLAMAGNPILGDDKYGDFSLNKHLQKAAGLKRMLLHSSKLMINNETNLQIHSPLPKYFHLWVENP